MANQDAAFGLKAIGKVGQNRDNQGLSEYSIAASSSAIYQNDPVKTSGGYLLVAGAGGDFERSSYWCFLYRCINFQAYICKPFGGFKYSD
jgi:hypothetical protein